jgi:hypothetical protein
MFVGLSSGEENEKPDQRERTVKQQEEENPLLTDLDPRGKREKKTQQAELWFERVQFTGTDTLHGLKRVLCEVEIKSSE